MKKETLQTVLKDAIGGKFDEATERSVSELNGLLPCPFCGGDCDPEGWLKRNGKGDVYERGPECEQCGATAESIDSWNSRKPARKYIKNNLSTCVLSDPYCECDIGKRCKRLPD